LERAPTAGIEPGAGGKIRTVSSIQFLIYLSRSVASMHWRLAFCREKTAALDQAGGRWQPAGTSRDPADGPDRDGSFSVRATADANRVETAAAIGPSSRGDRKWQIRRLGMQGCRPPARLLVCRLWPVAAFPVFLRSSFRGFRPGSRILAPPQSGASTATTGLRQRRQIN